MLNYKQYINNIYLSTLISGLLYFSQFPSLNSNNINNNNKKHTNNNSNNNNKEIKRLVVEDLLTKPHSNIYHFNKNDGLYLIIDEYRKRSGVYLLHSNIDSRQYVGSSNNLSIRLYNYMQPSKLMDNRLITNTLLLHNFEFSIVILSDLGDTGDISIENILQEEQKYIDIYKPELNTYPKAMSALGYKHTEYTKSLMSELRKGDKISLETKTKIAYLFENTDNNISDNDKKIIINNLYKLLYIENNDHYTSKSKEFLYYMFKSKKGKNNPMYGKKKSEDTLLKISSPIYVYNCNKKLINFYKKTTLAASDLKIGAQTIKKYKDTNNLYKNMYFYSKLLN